jgi:hypothetical protein
MPKQPLDVQAVKFVEETLSGATLQATTPRGTATLEKAAHLNRVHSITVRKCRCAFAPSNIARLPAEEARHPVVQQRVISIAPKPLDIAPPSFGCHHPVVASNEQSRMVALFGHASPGGVTRIEPPFELGEPPAIPEKAQKTTIIQA